MSLIRTFLQVSIILGALQLSYGDNDACDGSPRVIEADSGEITTPGYSTGGYYTAHACTWIIQVSPDMHIQYTIEDFELEDDTYSAPNTCVYDHFTVEACDASSEYCGYPGFSRYPPNVNQAVDVANNEMSFFFKSDGFDHFKGFKVRWVAISPCNGCANGGTCVASNCPQPNCVVSNCPQPYCACVNGWTGDSCETSPCDSDPCENGGTCVVNTESSSGYVCKCTGLWSADSKCGSLDKKKLAILFLLLKLLQEQNRCKTFEKKYPLEYQMYYRKYNCPKPQMMSYQMAYIIPPVHTTA